MLLCHGTSASHLASILKDGLKPRGENKSEWAVESASDRVYLSDAYAFYFAQNAAKEGDDLLVVEVDVDLDHLYPDEDFLGFATSKNDIAKQLPALNERTLVLKDWILDQKDDYRKELTEESLKFLGNAAYLGTISRDRITRIARIPEKDVGRIIVSEFDPIIAPINYRFLGEQYRAFQQSLFTRYPLEVEHAE
jgi:hypothetical protein